MLFSLRWFIGFAIYPMAEIKSHFSVSRFVLAIRKYAGSSHPYLYSA
jgi:hypothetical protein